MTNYILFIIYLQNRTELCESQPPPLGCTVSSDKHTLAITASRRDYGLSAVIKPYLDNEPGEFCCSAHRDWICSPPMQSCSKCHTLATRWQSYTGQPSLPSLHHHSRPGILHSPGE